MDNTVAAQLFWNYLSVEIIQLAKKSKSPVLVWISAHTPWVNRIAAVAAAAATTAGFAYTFSTTNGAFTMSINAYVLAKALLMNWVGIKVFYKVLYPTGSQTTPVMTGTLGAFKP